MQFQADLLGAPVERSKMLENTALGAAFFAGLATGYWNSIEEIQDLWSPDMIFKPRRLNETLHNEILAWEAAVKAAMVSAE
jgi:glycerol kinase